MEKITATVQSVACTDGLAKFKAFKAMRNSAPERHFVTKKSTIFLKYGHGSLSRFIPNFAVAPISVMD